jgi:hypothetical protein
MNRLLIRSDYTTIRSDEYQRYARNRSSQTPSQGGARVAPNRAVVAWCADRDLQALRPAELSLRRRSGTWSEAISGHQSARRPTPPGLRPERHARSRCHSDRQLQQASRSSQRDLCDQHGTPTPARGSRVGRHEPGSHLLRHRQGGCGSRRHGCLLSCCWRLIIRSGERR